jgi:CBS domain-containing protein
MDDPTEVATIMTVPPVVVAPDLCLRDVAKCLQEGKAGAAIVTRSGQVMGIISERDFVYATANGADPDVVWAADVMAADPICIQVDDTVERALEVMLRSGARHLPVLTDGNLVGVMSFRAAVVSMLGPPVSA